jgi:predicted small metal-binding protein
MADYEFVCGSPVCDKRLVAATKDDLMTEVAVHVRVKHHIPQPTKSLVKFIEANTIREIPTTEGGRR